MTEVIRPFVSKIEAVKLASEIFNLGMDASSQSSVKELDSYCDRNFYLRGTKDGMVREFILKVVKLRPGETEAVIQEFNKVMLFLDENRVPCSVPMQTTSGKFLEMRKFVKTSDSCEQTDIEAIKPVQVDCAVKLLTFLPGKTLRDIPACNTELFFKVGSFAAEVDRLLKNFKSPLLEARRNIWDLSCFEHTMRVSGAITNPHHKQLLLNVEKCFELFIRPKLDALPKQYIYGDINDGNVLVQNIPGTTNYEISGLIDFAETNYTCRVFEVAVSAAYMTTMYLEDPVAAGAYTVAGYQKKNLLTQAESDLIFYLLQGRLYQSICFGTNASQQHPENAENLLYTVKSAWVVLDKFTGVSKDDFDEKWMALSQVA